MIAACLLAVLQKFAVTMLVHQRAVLHLAVLLSAATMSVLQLAVLQNAQLLSAVTTLVLLLAVLQLAVHQKPLAAFLAAVLQKLAATMLVLLAAVHHLAVLQLAATSCRPALAGLRA